MDRVEVTRFRVNTSSVSNHQSSPHVSAFKQKLSIQFKSNVGTFLSDGKPSVLVLGALFGHFTFSIVELSKRTSTLVPRRY